jgi:hypothetical protein
LETHTKASPRLCAIVAYYPTSIPDPSRTSYPMNTSVLMHLAGGEIGVRRNPEILGIQGKRKTIRKKIARGVGVGGEMKLGCPSYKYEGVEPGFAEHDLEDFNPIAEDLAWSRTLRVLREAFGIKVDIEQIRDQHLEGESTYSEELADIFRCPKWKTFKSSRRNEFQGQNLIHTYYDRSCITERYWSLL